jgi:arylsulfatase A-like enzyme
MGGVVMSNTTLEVVLGDKPNIVLILTDDQGWSELSEALHPEVPQAHSDYLHTPNMDRLGRNGMRFTSGYSPAPLCTPTRRCILCGTTAARSGSEFKSSWVPSTHMTIPKALKQADPDYRCAHFGKWGEQMISTPEECGYDASDGMTGNATGGMPKTLNPDKPDANHNNTPPYYIDNEDAKRTPTVTSKAIDFMRRQVRARRPFYVQVSYYAVHLSVVCRDDTLGKYQQKGIPDRGYTQAWAAMLEELDAAVGRLLDALAELGVDDNTYVVFMSDNGGRGTVPGGDTSRLPTNHPLTGAKQSLYEGGIRVPFLICGPGIRAGSHCHTPVAGYDLLPTFYELAGGKVRLPDEIDGTSLCPLLADPKEGKVERNPDGLIFHRPRRKFSAIRQDDYKLMLFWTAEGDVSSRELYRFNPDPREEGRDLSDVRPEKADALQEMLLNYLESVDAETPS